MATTITNQHRWLSPPIPRFQSPGGISLTTGGHHHHHCNPLHEEERHADRADDAANMEVDGNNGAQDKRGGERQGKAMVEERGGSQDGAMKLEEGARRRIEHDTKGGNGEHSLGKPGAKVDGAGHRPVTAEESVVNTGGVKEMPSAGVRKADKTNTNPAIVKDELREGEQEGEKRDEVERGSPAAIRALALLLIRHALEDTFGKGAVHVHESLGEATLKTDGARACLRVVVVPLPGALARGVASGRTVAGSEAAWKCEIVECVKDGSEFVSLRSQLSVLVERLRIAVSKS